MTKKVRILTAILIAVLFCGMTLAQEPAQDINANLHPNLARAQRLVAQANEYLEKAQKANRDDMKGHAERARQLLAQANQEIKLAAEAANQANAANAKRKKR
jgi:F0F1-type ATP synthase membrane subunit b/b'